MSGSLRLWRWGTLKSFTHDFDVFLFELKRLFSVVIHRSLHAVYLNLWRSVIEDLHWDSYQISLKTCAKNLIVPQRHQRKLPNQITQITWFDYTTAHKGKDKDIRLFSVVLCRGLVWPCDWDLKKLLASLGIVVCSHVLNVPIHSLSVGFWVYPNCGVEGKTLCLGVWQSSIGIVEIILGFW